MSIFSPKAKQALNDIFEGVTRWELWFNLGLHDIRQRYRRSTVGPFWLTISMAMMVLGIGYLYSGIFGQKLEDYLPYIATGLIVFSLISSVVQESSTVFIQSAATILQIKAPLSVYVYQMLWRNFLVFFHNIVIYVFFVIFLLVNPGWAILFSFLGLMLIWLNGIWIGIILGGISARFRDVPPIAASIMQIMFFLTPIFWRVDQLHDRELLVQLNPFYYLLEVVRMPLLGVIPAPHVWLIAVGINAVSALAAVWFYSRYRSRITYWL